ncbi:MSF1-domain-containing protein [Neocallimastix lanati (nom. inval.)]|jgi:hypothetical protein|uniref:MSF1-domain-containing protein n=1 Tax=Neocallimastix californiae TaxID=1754190 RepID=A0A1Y2BAI8_9FUNG|nr:MSF1-domain-containing protein [Neocallimastix sp. JGI-2020a]ORY31871.1 MSF1-domain-containing protein [Neocallimastix californiae]|eukprot:ORY31871.1 MSF1-domain-containing protein [Neocallimastix californiae]
MKLFEIIHRIPHPWTQVTQAHWEKYPNDHSAHISSVDTIERYVDENGILHTTRLLSGKQKIPKILAKIFNSSDVAYFHEVSTLDPKTHVLHAETVNLSFSNLILIEEGLTLQKNPEDPKNNTLFIQQARISAKGVLSGISKYTEEFTAKTFKANAANGRKGLEQVIDRIKLREQQASLIN